MDLYSIRRQLILGIPLTNIKLKVTNYSRVSTQNILQKNSLKNQKEHFDEMIKNNPNWTYIDGYTDEGITGTSDIKRDNFIKMIEDAKKGKFDLIITKEISRFSRNTLDSIKYTRELLNHGVAVLFVNDNINTAMPDAELRLTIMASMAQDEIRRLSERVKFGMNRAIINGKILGNNQLYGYKKEKNNLLIDEKESIVVKEIYNMYVINNYSLNKISKILKERNIKTKNNKNFSPTSISRILKNPKYKGYYCGKKTEIVDYITKKVKYHNKDKWIMYKDTDKIPPIIDEILWNKAQNKLISQSKNIKQTKYPLSNKIICQKHNALFYRRKIKNDIAWYCSKYLKEGKNNCNNTSIRQSEIKYILYDIIDNLEINYNQIINQLLSIYNSNKLDNNNKYKNNIEKLKQKKEKILELNIEGLLTNKEFKEKNIIYNNEIKELEKQINSNNIIINNKKICKFLNNKSIIKEKIIELILNKIIVTTNQENNLNLKIILNISSNNITKKYSFKRGYDKISTKRYIIKYTVST